MAIDADQHRQTSLAGCGAVQAPEPPGDRGDHVGERAPAHLIHGSSVEARERYGDLIERLGR